MGIASECLEAGEKQRQKERLKKQKLALPLTHSRKKGTKSTNKPHIQIVLGLSIIFNCSKSVFHYL